MNNERHSHHSGNSKGFQSSVPGTWTETRCVFPIIRPNEGRFPCPALVTVARGQSPGVSGSVLGGGALEAVHGFLAFSRPTELNLCICTDQ